MDRTASPTAAPIPLGEAVRRSFHERSWIVGPWQDFLLFVGTPLLIVPVFLGFQFAFSPEQIALVVASFGALGHHLPGMLRAYGDRALFRRFKNRFIVAPLFLATVCAAFTIFELSGLVLVAYVWGVWHGLMQTYGFIRIYDSKTGSPSAWTRRLDHWMCLAWFGAGVTLSPDRLYTIFEYFYQSGGPLLPAATTPVLRGVTIAALVIVNALFFANMFREWRRGNAPNFLKLLLMVSSFGFWFYCSVVIGNILVGIALFEVFHDVQYLSIVWLFNRARVEKDPTIGEFTRFVFRRSGGMMGIYVGLVFAYGAMNFVPRLIEGDMMRNGLMGLLVASGLLHFYYDSFIWKVHEKENREALGLAAGEEERKKALIPPWVLTAGRWSLFVVPLGILAAAQMWNVAEPLERRASLARLLPENEVALYDYGVALEEAGRGEEALASYRRAVEVDPTFAQAQYNLGNALKLRGDLEGAELHLTEAVALDPEHAEALNNLGNLKTMAGERRQAEVFYQRALEADPKLFEARQNYAELRRAAGDAEGAEALYREALELDPDLASAHQRLALSLRARGEVAAAVHHFERAVELTPDAAELRAELGSAYGMTGDLDRAERVLREAVALDRNSLAATLALGVTLEEKGDLPQALGEYERAARLAPDDPTAQRHLGNLLMRSGRRADAERAFARAIELAPDDAESHLALGVALATSGRVTQAIDQYRQAIERRPDWAVAHFNLANVLAVEQRFGEAIAHYGRALELDPAMSDARSNLEAVERHVAGS